MDGIQMASSTENPRLHLAEAQVARFKARAQAFIQPDNENTNRAPPMTLAMVLIINAIIFVRLLETMWPRSGRHYSTLDSLVRINQFQTRLIKLLDFIPFKEYQRQLHHPDQLSDKQMEEIRWFCLLIHEMQSVTGKTCACGAEALGGYFRMAVDRADRLVQGMRSFHRMYSGYMEEIMMLGEDAMEEEIRRAAEECE